MDGWIDARAEGGERKRHRVAERRLKDVEIDKMEIRQLREKIMCTIIDKQFESPAWQKQIQNLNLQTCSVHPLALSLSSVYFLSRAYIDKYFRAPMQTPKPYILSSPSISLIYSFSINLPVIHFPDWSSAFPFTNSKSLHDLCHLPPTLLYLPPYTSSISLCDTSVGSEESRQDSS